MSAIRHMFVSAETENHQSDFRTAEDLIYAVAKKDHSQEVKKIRRRLDSLQKSPISTQQIQHATLTPPGSNPDPKSMKRPRSRSRGRNPIKGQGFQDRGTRGQSVRGGSSKRGRSMSRPPPQQTKNQQIGYNSLSQGLIPDLTDKERKILSFMRDL